MKWTFEHSRWARWMTGRLIAALAAQTRPNYDGIRVLSDAILDHTSRRDAWVDRLFDAGIKREVIDRAVRQVCALAEGHATIETRETGRVYFGADVNEQASFARARTLAALPGIAALGASKAVRVTRTTIRRKR